MESEQGQLLTPEEVVDRIFLLVDENGDGNGSGDGGITRQGCHWRVMLERVISAPTGAADGGWAKRGESTGALESDKPFHRSAWTVSSSGKWDNNNSGEPMG